MEFVNISIKEVEVGFVLIGVSAVVNNFTLKFNVL